jgi:hypothetical protein
MTPVQFHRQQAIRLCGCVGVLQPDPGAFVTVVTVTATCPLADPRNPEYSIWCRHDNISNLQLGGEGYVALGSLGIRQQSIVLLCPPHIHAQTQLRFECSQSRSHHHGCPHSRVVEEGDQWKRGISGRGGSVEEGDQWNVQNCHKNRDIYHYHSKCVNLSKLLESRWVRSSLIACLP